MATLYPSQYLGLGDELGKVKQGYKAHLAVFDNEIHVSAIVVDGKFLESQGSPNQT
jgi:N-acetylglucosamine-6-phosphate deacetylase